MDYSNLSSKTVFDFTSDLEVLGAVVGSYNLESEEQIANYISLEKTHPRSNAIHLLILAEDLGDEHLENAVRQQFSDVLSAIYNE